MGCDSARSIWPYGINAIVCSLGLSVDNGSESPISCERLSVYRGILH